MNPTPLREPGIESNSIGAKLLICGGLSLHALRLAWRHGLGRRLRRPLRRPREPGAGAAARVAARCHRLARRVAEPCPRGPVSRGAAGPMRRHIASQATGRIAPRGSIHRLLAGVWSGRLGSAAVRGTVLATTPLQVPRGGLEPPLPCGNRILNPRHGLRMGRRLTSRDPRKTLIQRGVRAAATW